MRSSRLSGALMIIASSGLVASAQSADRAGSPPCTQLEGQIATIRGKVSVEYDNMDPETDFGDRLVLDPMEEVFLVTLHHPICVTDETSPRPVVQDKVTIVELSLDELPNAEDFRRHVGHVRKIEGKLFENVWWRYKATMRIAVTKIER